MAYNPNKGEIYMNDGASIAIISDNSNSVVGTVNINGYESTSNGIAYDSGTSTVYAISNPGSTSGSMGQPSGGVRSIEWNFHAQPNLHSHVKHRYLPPHSKPNLYTKSPRVQQFSINFSSGSNGSCDFICSCIES